MSFRAHGFHVGMVVDDAHGVARDYQRLLGGEFRVWETGKSSPRSIDPTLEDTRLRIAYGRYGGMTVELIQVLSGRGHYARWREQHGNGVQHLGFWVPDLTLATTEALAAGATVQSATLDPKRLGAVTLTGLTPERVAGALLPGPVHASYSSTTVEIELLGPTSVDSLRAVLADATERIVSLPEWSIDQPDVPAEGPGRQ